MAVQAKEPRLVARASHEVLGVIKSAADVLGMTVSQFVLEAATVKASTILTQFQTIKLTQEGAERMFDLLNQAPAPNEKLLRAARRYEEIKAKNVDHRGNTSEARPK